ncbi:hypothetical protein NRB20_74780 [Nocardia sp. RB20]|uniref:HTH cro/C1-type domain-containing protein n=1 Tax=Nocardia macrotermitis TaxID=2585198 RepID=A0A7K0DEX4_9NOCA|nr:hypothetical protein [Nocardia macrotermitis]
MIDSGLEQKELGRRLRALRRNAKLSQSAAARAIEVSPQTIGRLEDGQATQISKLHVAELCNIYQAGDSERAALTAFVQHVRAARHKGGPSAVIAGFVGRVELEQVASTVTVFADTMVPGLLRTVDYHQLVRRMRYPHDSDEDIEYWRQYAGRRWIRLYDRAFQVQVFLLESVLHHLMGDPALMAQQLAHLEQIGRLPNVNVRVIPADAGNHIGLYRGGFTLMEFGPSPAGGWLETPIVYAKGYPKCLYLRDEGDIDQYHDAVTQLDHVAQSPETSMEVMRNIKEKYWARTDPDPGEPVDQ